MSQGTADCRTARERLTAYVDDTLEPTQQASLRQHLAACPPCRVAESLERGGRELLKACGTRLQAVALPLGLRSRCEAAALEAVARSATARPGMPVWRTRLIPLSLAVLLMVFFASAFVSLATHRSDGLLAAQLSRDHAWCFQRFAGATSADAGEMEQMFADRYGWHVRVPPTSAAAGIQLIGAKRCFYAGGGVPHILYRVNGEEMSLYVLEGESRPSADLVAGGRRSRIWSHDDTTFVLVSAPRAGDMTLAASYVMQDAH